MGKKLVCDEKRYIKHSKTWLLTSFSDKWPLIWDPEDRQVGLLILSSFWSNGWDGGLPPQLRESNVYKTCIENCEDLKVTDTYLGWLHDSLKLEKTEKKIWLNSTGRQVYKFYKHKNDPGDAVK